MKQFFRLLCCSSIVAIGAITFETVVTARQPNFQRQLVATPRISTSLTLADSRAIAGLAAHLKKVGAKMYGAYWCPHCTRQKEMFGAAFKEIDYVECDPRGENPRPNLCKEAGVKGYPTWKVNGKSLVGVQSLEELAKASGYKGAQKF